MRAETVWSAEPDIQAFVQGSRLNILRGLAARRDDPELKAAMAMIGKHREATIQNLRQLHASNDKSRLVGDVPA